MQKNSSRPTLILLVLLLGLVGAACSGNGSDDSPQVGTITSVDGTVELVRNGDRTQAEVDARLFEGDALTVRGVGVAEFTLGGGGAFELVRGTVEMGAPNRLALSDATLLIVTDEPVDVSFGDFALAFGRGVVRVDLVESGRIAAYGAEDLAVTVAGRTVPLPPLWELALTGDGEFGQARPIQFSREDPIDVRYLAQALEVDGKLGNLIRGSEPQLAAVEAASFRSRFASAGLDPEVLAPFENASRSDLLMGLAFARTWKDTEPEALVEGFGQVVALRVLGATWGLAAQMFDVDGDALVAAFQEEIAAVLFPAGPGPGGGLVPSTSPSLRPPPVPAPPAPAPGPGPAPVSPGTPAPSPSASPGLLGPVLDPLRPLLPGELEAIIDELYGLVGGLLPIL